MITLILVASQKWAKGYSLENISRELNVPFERLSLWVKRNPELFTQELFASKVCNFEQKGLPPRAPGTHGIPRKLLLKGQCCFPLWGNNETPDDLSLVCGEPVIGTSPYCGFHYNLAYNEEVLP